MVKYNYKWKDFTKFTFEEKKIILIAVFCVAGVLSDILAVKLINWGFITLECGCILFPLVYILNDSIVDLYGEKTMMKTAVLGMSMKILMVIVCTLCILAPYDPITFGTTQTHLESVLGFVPRIVIASLIGYIAGGAINARTMSIFGNLTNGKHLFVRTILSTVFGELVDTILFIGIAFYNTMPLESLLVFILTQYLLKVGIEVVLQPLTYKIISWTRGSEDSLDYKREDFHL